MATAKKAPVKKATAPKTQENTETKTWNTIHVFGFGNTQVIGSSYNGKVANSELKSLDALFTALAAKQQKGTKITQNELHALNIYNGILIDFFPASGKNKHQRFAWSEVDAKHIENLAKEIIGKVPEQKVKRNFPAILKRTPEFALRRNNAIADA